MTNRPIRPVRAALIGGVVLAGSVLAGSAAYAEGPGPVYKDTERFGGPPDVALYPPPLPVPGREPGRPARLVDSGPGYVGSDYGLGKPAFTGLGSRPDWGRSSP